RLRRDIENRLYAETLIPEARGDVLRLLESSDKVLNKMTETLISFSDERPLIVEEIKNKYLELTDISMKAVESMEMAIRSYLRDINAVRDHVNKVYMYEKESDQITTMIKKDIFSMNIDLSQKLHMRHFVICVEEIADEAEDVCDMLAIFTIKRSI
ncbi:DUF47 domain-containing protein, partial [candidate division KSB1 bacterium]